MKRIGWNDVDDDVDPLGQGTHALMVDEEEEPRFKPGDLTHVRQGRRHNPVDYSPEVKNEIVLLTAWLHPPRLANNGSPTFEYTQDSEMFFSDRSLVLIVSYYPNPSQVSASGQKLSRGNLSFANVIIDGISCWTWTSFLVKA